MIIHTHTHKDDLKSAILGDIQYATLNLDKEENKVYETNLKEKK